MTLALSLHAPNDEKRRELMPIANKYSMDEFWKHADIILTKQDAGSPLSTVWWPE